MTMFFNGKKPRLKLFDIAIIFIFIFLIVSFFFILFRKKSEIKVVVKVNEESLAWSVGGTPTWFAQLLRVGMKETDTFGRPMAKVTEVKTYFIPENKKVVYLVVDLKTVYSSARRQHTYKGKEVLVGSTIQLSLDGLLVKGLIVNIEGLKKPHTSNKLLVKAQLKDYNPVFPQAEGVPYYLAEGIKEGDEMKDSLNNPAVKIIKKTVEDAKITVITASGEVFLQRHPMRKDVFLTLEVWAEKIGERYYLFGDTDLLVLIGQHLPLYFNTISFFPIVTHIEPIQ